MYKERGSMVFIFVPVWVTAVGSAALEPCDVDSFFDVLDSFKVDVASMIAVVVAAAAVVVVAVVVADSVVVAIVSSLMVVAERI